MKRKLLDGVVKRHPDGFGFFVPEDPSHPDVYIPKNSMIGIMTNDRVRISVFPEHAHKSASGGRFRGEIEQVLKRAVTKLMGRFTKGAYNSGIILDHESTWGGNIVIPEGKTKDAQDEDLVVVRLTGYASLRSDLTGEVVEILGKDADPLVDTRRVIFAQGIPDDWSKGVLEDAAKLPKTVEPSDFKNRKDLRALEFVTIDGATAKDFDDAVLVENNDRGFHIYVAIADVSHYVKPKSLIDQDAYTRGNSTYFPSYVVPMLPEQLSNELCSLKPSVPRLALVADMQVDLTGALTSSSFYEAVIQSHARVIYGEAQEVFDGSTPEHLKHVEKALMRASDVAKVLMAKRFKDGSMDLEIPETQIILDEAGNPVDIIRAERIFANRVIEELMLLANIAVAKFISKNDKACLYRIHEAPATDNLATLNRFLMAFGADREIEGDGIQKKITRALQQFAGKPQAEILNILTLRSMKQAKYSPANVGHFGLGFSDYAHFTSPIRRYPDLIIHRILKSIVMKSGGYAASSEEDLLTAGTHLSGCEQRSAKAERQFKAIKRARFMKQFLGAEFDGVISSVTKFGAFVLLRAYDVDGLIRVDDLGHEAFEFDEETLTLTGKKTRFSYALGDPIRIQVAATDSDLGQVNFVLAEKVAEVGDTAADNSLPQVGAKPNATKTSVPRSFGENRNRERGTQDRPKAASKRTSAKDESSRGSRRKRKWERETPTDAAAASPFQKKSAREEPRGNNRKTENPWSAKGRSMSPQGVRNENPGRKPEVRGPQGVRKFAATREERERASAEKAEAYSPRENERKFPDRKSRDRTAGDRNSADRNSFGGAKRATPSAKPSRFADRGKSSGRPNKPTGKPKRRG